MFVIFSQRTVFNLLTMNQTGPMKPWIKKITPPRIAAAGLLGPDLVDKI